MSNKECPIFKEDGRGSRGSRLGGSVFAGRLRRDRWKPRPRVGEAVGEDGGGALEGRRWSRRRLAEVPLRGRGVADSEIGWTFAGWRPALRWEVWAGGLGWGGVLWAACPVREE